MRGLSIKLITDGFFKTIPNTLRQLPLKNLITPEAPLKSIGFKELKCYLFLNHGLEFIKEIFCIMRTG